MKIKAILSFLVFFVILSLLCNWIVYGMVSQICEETELKPVRYEFVGLFGNQRIPIVTSEGNEDSYEKVCVRTGTPKFWGISENIEYLVSKSDGGRE